MLNFNIHYIKESMLRPREKSMSPTLKRRKKNVVVELSENVTIPKYKTAVLSSSEFIYITWISNSSVS